MRDNTLATALNVRGHDCLLIPTYTPIRTDEPDVSVPRIFFGGLSIYLEQKAAFFRRMPRLISRLLSGRSLLRVVSRFAIKTRPEELGELTVSMLRGLEGNQCRDVLELAGWLEREFQPDVVCLSNALLSGVAAELKRRFHVPVLCALQGDDIYLDWLPGDHRQQALQLIQQNCQFIDGYIATSRYFADFMAVYLAIPRERIQVVLPGVNLKGYPIQLVGSQAMRNPLAVGYLARICPEKGLHVLVEAFNHLRQMPGVPACRLRVAGYLGERDRPYLQKLQQQVKEQGWADRFEYIGEPDHAGKIRFLQSLDVFSVPTTYREPKGLYVLEAWACGVPAVQPKHGSFAELIEATGGGLLIPPEDPAELAAALERLLSNADERTDLGRRGFEAVRARFTADRMAEQTLGVFQQYVRKA
jgi:glycosyltransferase involved in cell wall biosynthesis